MFPENGFDMIASGEMGIEKLDECGQSSRSVLASLMFLFVTWGTWSIMVLSGEAWLTSFGTVSSWISSLMRSGGNSSCSGPADN